MRASRTIAASIGVAFFLFAAALGWLYVTRGAYGVDAVMRRGASYWTAMAPDDPRLSPSMRLAMRETIPSAHAGAFTWMEPEPGFEVAEMPVLADGREVDRILLSRIDPRKYRFIVRNVVGRDIDDWERALPNDVLIVNGSYYDLKGRPDTPVVSEGAALGPLDYEAKAGAFVDSGVDARLVDLAHEDWKNRVVERPQCDGVLPHVDRRRRAASRGFGKPLVVKPNFSRSGRRGPDRCRHDP